MIRAMRATPFPAAIVIVVASICGWGITSLPAFSAGATVAVLGFGLGEIAVIRACRARRRDGAIQRAAPAPRSSPAGYLVWAAAIAVLAGWELFTLFSHPRSAHPTISSMTDPLMGHHPIRWLFFAAWAWLGWLLAR
jgi:hypothetical protein